MDKEKVGMAVGVLGAVIFLAAVIKFAVIGFYPDEAITWLVVLAVGAVVAGAGQRLFTAGRNERFQ